MTEPVAHRFKWEEKMSWQYGDGYDATGAVSYTHLTLPTNREV